MRILFYIFSMALLTVHCASAGNEIIIPVAGNAYLTSVGPGFGDRVGRTDISDWESPETCISVWFHVDKPVHLKLGLRMEIPEGASEISVHSCGKAFIVKAGAGGEKDYEAGWVTVEKSGYVRVDIRGVKKSGSRFALLSGLTVSLPDDSAVLSFVKDNVDNRFYWGRRGPSVHLSYKAPDDTDLEWFYSEITVPEGEDIIGSYFMANGFAEGYFGMQVNSETERRVIFSVWSPFVTDNPEEIPEEDRIRVLRKGDQTIAHDFGNEGSGGHSRILFPWKAGVTYRFLNRVKPDGNGNTLYSAWFFAPETGSWQFITTFSRPKTDTWLKRPHSFLENFVDRNGYLGRMAWYGNQWACDTNGKWHRLTEARFTGDDIARRGYRLDFAGGMEGDRFFLRNGGFFSPPVPLNSTFTVSPKKVSKPDVDFSALP